MIDVWCLVPSRKFVMDASQCLDMARLSQAFVEADEMALKLLSPRVGVAERQEAA